MDEGVLVPAVLYDDDFTSSSVSSSSYTEQRHGKRRIKPSVDILKKLNSADDTSEVSDSASSFKPIHRDSESCTSDTLSQGMLSKF